MCCLSFPHTRRPYGRPRRIRRRIRKHAHARNRQRVRVERDERGVGEISRAGVGDHVEMPLVGHAEGGAAQVASCQMVFVLSGRLLRAEQGRTRADDLIEQRLVGRDRDVVQVDPLLVLQPSGRGEARRGQANPMAEPDENAMAISRPGIGAMIKATRPRAPLTSGRTLPTLARVQGPFVSFLRSSTTPRPDRSRDPRPP